MVTGSEAVLRTLEAQGVEHVFGVCGDTSVGLYRTFHDAEQDIEHVLARDERGAAYMADAYARLSAKPGVCEGPSGGGATYLLPGLAESNDSNVPVIGLNTTIPTRYRGRGVLTELDQDDLFDTVTKWNTAVDHPDQISRMLRQAFRKATTGRPGATHLSLPMDVLDGETDERVYGDTAAGRCPSYRPPAPEESLDRAADLLAASEQPVAVVGGGVHTSRCWDTVRALAEHLGLPVAQTLTSAGCVGDSPYSIGVVGENGGREYADEIVRTADTVLLLGTAVESVWTYKWSQPRDGEQTIIHADIDPESIGMNYETEVALPGDLRRTADALLDRMAPAEKWDPEELAARHRNWLSTFEPEFDSDDMPLRPERMVMGANEVLDDDAVIISDPGTACPYFASLYPFSEPGCHWITPRAHGALGYTIPAVVGAHYARPDSQIIGFTGDGSFGTSAGDLETIARRDLPVTVVIVNNESFSWIEAGQRNFADFSFAVDFDGLNYADIAEEFGITGFRVDAADEYEDVLESALSLDGPAVIDLPTQPLPTLENTPVDWLEPDE
jgi:acetolactate synthase-1/2/3 large subunit